jgi:GNAT superfamily N-acetyltransferase
VSERLGMEPMTEEELAAYLSVTREGYIRQRVELGGEDPEQARQVADRQYAEFFPGGRPAEGHLLFTGRDSDTGTTVGRLWLHTRRGGAGTSVWIFDVEVDEDRRGQGWGRELMTYAEKWARGQGAGEIGLNVFGGNTVARRLYSSLGYDERSVTMGRRLHP